MFCSLSFQGLVNYSILGSGQLDRVGLFASATRTKFKQATEIRIKSRLGKQDLWSKTFAHSQFTAVVVNGVNELFDSLHNLIFHSGSTVHIINS